MASQNDTPWWDKTTANDESTPWWDQPKEAEESPWWDTTASAAQTITEEAPPQEQAAQPADAGSKPLRLEPGGELNNTLRSTAHLIIHWCNQNTHTVIYTLIGLLCALGILKIGFWKTALFVIFIGGGFIIGSWHDGNPHLMQRIRGFSHRFLDNNPFMKDE